MFRTYQLGLKMYNSTIHVYNISTLSATQNYMSCNKSDDFKYPLYSSVFSIVFVVGLFFNMVAIYIFGCTLKLRNETTTYMINLVVSDSLFVLSLPFRIAYFIKREWLFGSVLCKISVALFYTNMYGSILFLTCISVQRYVGICHPLAMWHKQGGRRFAWCICGGVWLVVIVLCAPTFHFAATGIQRNRTVCYDLSTPKHSVDYYPYGMALTCLGFLLPFMGVMVCYCRMAHILCRPVSYQGVSMATGEKRDKAVRMIIVVAAVFCMSFLPFHLTKTVYLVVRALPGAPCETRNLFSIIYKSTRPFASMNSFLDPILFYFTQPRYRRSTRRFVLRVTTLKDKGTTV